MDVHTGYVLLWGLYIKFNYVCIFIPIEHLETSINHPVNVSKMFQSETFFSLRLFKTGRQQMFVVCNSVVSIFVQGSQKFLQTFLNSVRLKVYKYFDTQTCL